MVALGIPIGQTTSCSQPCLPDIKGNIPMAPERLAAQDRGMVALGIPIGQTTLLVLPRNFR